MSQSGRILAVLLLLSGIAHGEDWPQWRGPNRDNAIHEKNLLKQFPAEGLKILWRAKIGPGYSSPIVGDGRVFASDSLLANPNARERLHCFEEKTGEPLWTDSYKVEYPAWVFTDPVGMGPTSTPIAHDGKLYTLGMMGELRCLDAKTSNVLWRKDLAREYAVKEFSCRSSPLIEKNLLILNIGGKPNAAVVAFDKDSGAEVWKALDEGLTNSSPIVITAGGQRQLIVWTLASVTSLDPATGKVLWTEHLVTDNNPACSTPVFNSERNLLLVGGMVMQLEVDKPKATILWPTNKARAKRILSETSTPLFHGQDIFWSKPGGELACIDALTGRELWNTDKVTDQKNGSLIQSAPAADIVYLFTDKGDLISAQLSRDGYTEISRAHLIDPTYPYGGRKVCWAAPAYANGRIFARSDKELVCASLARP